VIMRHGLKENLRYRFDLPILPENELYCEDFKAFCFVASGTLRNPIIFSSPFTRTRQTSGRLAKEIGYKGPIIISNDFSETWQQVSKQLKKCRDKSKYRGPVPPYEVDSCMSKLKGDESSIYNDARNEIQNYTFMEDNSDFSETAEEVNSSFKSRLLYIINKVPFDRDIVIVTHGRHVRKSIDILKPRILPRLAFVPDTCGTVVFAESINGNIRILKSSVSFL